MKLYGWSSVLSCGKGRLKEFWREDARNDFKKLKLKKAMSIDRIESRNRKKCAPEMFNPCLKEKQ